MRMHRKQMCADKGCFSALNMAKKACLKGTLFSLGSERGAVVTCSACLMQDWRRWMTRLAN